MRKLFTLLIILCAWTVSSWAQVNPYAFSASSGTYTAITGGTQHSSGSLMDDATFSSVPIGFSFTLNGVAYTTVTLSENGYVIFGGTTSLGYDPLNSTTTAGACAAAMARDLQGIDATSELRSQQVGTSFIIQWKNVKRYGASYTSENLNFQIILNQTSNTIDMVYGTCMGSSYSGATQPQVGLRGSGNTDFHVRTTTTDWSATTKGTTNMDKCTLSNTIYPALNQKFTFSPPPPCVDPTNQPSGLTVTPTPFNSTSLGGTFSAASPAPSGYLVVRYPSGAAATDPVKGTVYTVGSALGLGTVVSASALTTFTATGLAPSTTYDFYIYSYNNTDCSTIAYLVSTPALFGAGTTSGVQTITSTATGGLWSSPLTWTNGVVPPSTENVFISSGAIVTVDQLVTARNLTVSGILQWGSSSNAITVFNNILINSGGQFLPYTTGGTGQTINIGGDFINDGYTNLALSSTVLNFNGSTQLSSLGQTLSGTGTFQGDGTNGIIRGLFFQTTGSSAISTTQNLIVTTDFATTAGSLNTNGKLTINNTSQVFGQPLNSQVANVAVTNMGVAYTNSPFVFGASVSPWAAAAAFTAGTRYYFGNNVYLCTTAGTSGLSGPFSTAPTTFTDGTAIMLYIGTRGTLGNPFITGSLVLGTQYFYGGNLYVAVLTTAPGTTPPIHTSGVVGSFLYVGTPAQVSVNYDAVSQTVRSLNIVNAGSGYISLAPSIVFSSSVAPTTSAAATAVLIQAIAGAANSRTQKSPVATISGGLNIVSTQGVGGISTTTGGYNYSAAPSVGFPLPTGFLNLVTAEGAGYTGTPTVTVSGGTKLAGGTDPTFTVTMAQGKIVSVVCLTGGTLWTSVPTLTLTGGGFTSLATCEFPATCLPTATATISNGVVTGFTVTNAGFGYPSAPSPALVTNGTVTTAAASPTCRIALYNLTYNYFSPALTNPPVTAGVEIPSNNRVNILTMGSSTSSATSANITLTTNLELYASSGALVFPSSTSVGNLLNLNGFTLTYSHPSNGGTTGSPTLGSVTNGPITIKSVGGGATKNFPFDATFTVVTGTTGSSMTTLTATRTGAPSGSGSPIGTRAYRLQVNAGAVFGTAPTITLNYNGNDALVSDVQSLMISQSSALTGAWTVRSVTTGTGILPATGSRTTATASPGPVNGDEYFAWSSTYVPPPPLSYSIVRTTGNAFSSIMGTGTAFAWNGASVSTDDNVSTAVTIPSSTFTFQGQTITGFNLCTNGWIKLISATSPSTTSTTYNNTFTAGIPLIVAPFWDDLTTNPSNSLLTTLTAHTKYQINGSTPGTRQIICEWYNYTVFNAAGPQLTFQVVLDETDNSVKFNYGLFQGFNGTNNHRYTYSCGLGGLVVNPAPLTGQVLAQQYENTTDFSYQYAATMNAGANGLMSIPECNSSIKFTPGSYAGFTPPVPAAPVNDEYTGAITVPALLSFPPNLCGNFYSSRYATPSAQTVCGGNNDDDVWFKFEASQPSTTVRLYGSGGYVPRVQVLDNALNPLAPPMCVVGSAGGTFVDANLTGITVGNIYYVRVYHDGGGVQATATAVLLGNTVGSVTITNGGSGYTSTNTGYYLTGRVRFTGGGGTDAVGSLSLTSGAVSGVTVLNAGYGYTSAPTVTIESPSWAHIGEFALVVYAPAVNDDCAGAIALTGLATPGCNNGTNSRTDNTESATPSPELAACGTPDDDIWYKFDAVNANTEILVSATGTFDPAFEIWDGGVAPGSCASKATVVCVNSGGAGVTESVLQATTVGHTYFVRVYHAGTGTAINETFTICVSSAVPACVSAPNTPANAGSVCPGAINLSWLAVSGASTYDVYLDAGNVTPVTLVSGAQAGTSFTTAVLPSGPYSWKVIPKNTFGDATGCSTFTFTVNTPPEVQISPKNATYCPGSAAVEITASGAGLVSYSWSPSTGLDVTTGPVVHASPTTTTTYTVTGFDNAGCSGTATCTVTVLPLLYASATATPNNVCQGGSSVLTATASNAVSSYCIPTFSGTGASGDYIAGFSFADLTNTSGDEPTDYTYYSAMTANVVADGTTSYAITCTAGPSWTQNFRVWIDFNHDGLFETTESVFSTATSTAVANGYTTIPNTAYNGVTRMRVASRYSSVIDASMACVIPSAYGEFEDYNITITGGQTAPAPPVVTFSWSPATYLGGVTTGTPVNATNIAATITYTVTAEATDYCPATATAIITVNPLVCNALTTGGASPCAGVQTVNANISGGKAPFTYSWTEDALPFGGNTASVTASVGTHTYTCTVSDACNGSCSSSLSVTTYAIPVVSVTPQSSTYCTPDGPAVALTASGATSYSWSPAAGLDATTGSVVYASPAANTIYTVTGTDNGCTSTGTATVTLGGSVTMGSVSALPPSISYGGASVLSASATVAALPPVVYCVPVQLGTSCITGVSFSTLVGTPAACVTPYYNINAPTGSNTTTVTQGSTYSLTVDTDPALAAIVSVWIDYDQNGTFDASEWVQPYTNGSTGTVSVTIPLGAVNGVTGMRVRSRNTSNPNGATDACSSFGSGSTEDYTITIGTPPPPVAVSYSWSPATFLGGVTTGTPVNATNVTATTTYTCTATAGGCSSTGTATVTVLCPLPVAPGTISGPSTVTQGQTGVGFSVPVIANATGYVWSLPFGASITAGNNTNSITVSFSASALSGVITVYGTNSCGNGPVSANFTLTVNPGVPAFFSVSGEYASTVCFNATNTLTVGGTGTPFSLLGPTGNATFIAGIKILFEPGTQLQNGSKAHAYISTTYCSPSSLAPVTVTGTGNDETPSQLSRANFTLYPNPTSGNFTLVQKGDRTFGTVKLEVYTMSGEKVMTEQMIGEKKHEFRFSEVPVGLYFVKVVADNYVETIKLVKVR